MADSFAGGPATSAAPIRQRSIDWVEIARFITLGYGGLIVLGLVILSLVGQHINVPYTDGDTGETMYLTGNPGPFFAILAVIVGVVFILFTWLTKFFVARIVFLIFDGLAILGTLRGLSSGQAITALSTVDLLIDLGYGAVLIMSLMSPRAAAKT